MKTITVKLVGFPVQKSVPSKVAEFANLGMTEEQVVDQANRYITYHVWMGECRDVIQEAVEELTEEPRKFEYSRLENGDLGKAKNYTEKFEEYIKRVLDLGKISEAELKDVVEEAARDTEYKAVTARVRKNPDHERRLKIAAQILRNESDAQKLVVKCGKLDIPLVPRDQWTVEIVAEAVRQIEE